MEDRYLFRGKRIDNGEWVKGFYAVIGEKTVIIEKEREEFYDLEGDKKSHGNKIVEVDPSTICQCTGLRDKNGKLIWENDIMVAHLDDKFPEDTTYTRVVWNNNGFCTKEQGSEDIMTLDKFDQEHFEVCGNLFDNPELLEVGE